jgi:Cd2+/Zn2+-exporting ATPase
MDKEGIQFAENGKTGTAVYIALNGSYMGSVIISDKIKKDSRKAIKRLKELGVKRIAMFTGDARPVADAVGKELGLDEVYAELLPHQKVEMLEKLYVQKRKKGVLVFVGDGINDAPVLSRADVGIAMGGLGSDAAIEAADVVIMTDEPSKLGSAIALARRTRSNVWQNVIFAFAVKGIVLLLGAGGLATMWEAVFADIGVALLAILNAMRVFYVKKEKLN